MARFDLAIHQESIKKEKKSLVVPTKDLKLLKAIAIFLIKSSLT